MWLSHVRQVYYFLWCLTPLFSRRLSKSAQVSQGPERGKRCCSCTGPSACRDPRYVISTVAAALFASPAMFCNTRIASCYAIGITVACLVQQQQHSCHASLLWTSGVKVCHTFTAPRSFSPPGFRSKSHQPMRLPARRTQLSVEGTAPR